MSVPTGLHLVNLFLKKCLQSRYSWVLQATPQTSPNVVHSSNELSSEPQRRHRAAGGTCPRATAAQRGGGECPWGAQSRPGLRRPAPLGPGNAAHSATCWREPRAQLGCCSCICGLRYQLQVVFISTILLLALLTLLCFPLPLVSLPGELLTG